MLVGAKNLKGGSCSSENSLRRYARTNVTDTVDLIHTCSVEKPHTYPLCLKHKAMAYKGTHHNETSLKRLQGIILKSRLIFDSKVGKSVNKKFALSVFLPTLYICMYTQNLK